MRTYPVLRTIAAIIKVLAVIGGIGGVLIALFSLRDGFFMFLVTLFATALSIFLQWAVGELILLVVNAAEDLDATKWHAHEMKQELRKNALANPTAAPASPASPASGA